MPPGRPLDNEDGDVGRGSRRLAGGVVTMAALAMSGLIALNMSAAAPKVAPGYFDKVQAAGTIEKRYTAMGPHPVAREEHPTQEPGLGKISIWYPADLRSGANAYPVVIMANGTRIGAARYQPIFEHLASWGFIVAGNEAGSSGSGRPSAVTLDFVLAQNDNPASALYRKVDRSNIGAAGHSQGGNGTVRALTEQPNGKLYKAIFTASMMRNVRFAARSIYDLREVRVPYFMVAGDADGFFAPLSSVRANFAAIPEGVPAVMARRNNASHGDMLSKADGYMTAWFRYYLAGDQVAARAFVGETPEIERNAANWRDVGVKNVK